MEIMIPNGITGIIGPNGCGKSNIFEAIRWVMGESSSKSLRSSSMDELIFSGTETLPEKNIAEVSIELEMNRESKESYGEDKIIVSRLIERGVGSFYKINNKDVRAKDVNILFSDSGSGPRSSSIISQGNIDQIINFKPLERKTILEDAAGISGLQTRRRDSELKLDATENNLHRIADNILNLEKQLQSLKRQSRQAESYQNISDKIKISQKKLLYLKWKFSNEDVLRLKKDSKDILKRIENINSDFSITEKKLINLKKSKETLEREKLDLDKLLNKKKIQIENITNQKDAFIQRKKEIQSFLHSIKNDESHEIKRLEEIKDNIKQLQSESYSNNEIKNLKQQLRLENIAESELNKKISNLESILYSEIQLTLGKEFKKDNIIEFRSTTLKKKTEIYQEMGKIKIEIKSLKKKIESFNSEKIVRTIEVTTKQIRNFQNKYLDLQKKIGYLDIEKEKKSKIYDNLFNELTKINTELETLKKFTNNLLGSKKSIMNLIKIKKGYEKAVFIALKYELDAEISRSGKFWVNTQPKSNLPKLPFNTKSIKNVVNGPKQLNQILSQIGLVATKESGFKIQKELNFGQSIVSKEGAIWRWDGLFSEKETEENKLFKNLKRLTDLEKDKTQLRKDLIKMKVEVESINSKIKTFSSNQTKINKELQSLKDFLIEEEEKLNELKNKFSNEKNSIYKLEEKYSFLSEQKNKLIVELSSIRDKLKLEKSEPVEHTQTKKSLESLKQEIKKKREIIGQINEKILSIEIKSGHFLKSLQDNKKREVESITRLENYKERIDKLTLEKESLMTDPKKYDLLIVSLSEDVNFIDKEMKEKQSQINKNIDEIKESVFQEKKLLTRKSELSESKVRLEENLFFKKNNQVEVEENMIKQFNIHPSQMEVDFEKIENETYDFKKIQSEIDDMIMKRNLIGPVNLRAYIEQKEISEELDLIRSDRDDVLLAIKKLRKAIVEINQEGKKRLLKAFNLVNQNFSTLFTKFFSGGSAYLELVNSEDPLQTGIEIFARPPGKKLTSISLLSGGEKTLTAVSLIFSIFLIKPSPICILDEVDAALDDENVEKFCNILNEIKNQTKTKFMIVTHHKITMSMVDKLYGVTMNEKGISDLVSVDFDSEEYREAI